LEREALKARLEVNENKTKYMGVIRNLPNLKQARTVDSHVFWARMFKYLGALITGKNEITEEIKMRIAASYQHSAQHSHSAYRHAHLTLIGINTAILVTQHTSHIHPASQADH
jgi:hypothetical protein